MLLSCLPVLSISTSSENVLLLKAGSTCIKHSRATTTEEHSENVICIELILSKLLRIPLLEILFSTMLIIDLSFFWVAQAGKSCTDLLESISGIRGSIFIRMKLKSELLVCLFNILL